MKALILAALAASPLSGPVEVEGRWLGYCPSLEAAETAATSMSDSPALAPLVMLGCRVVGFLLPGTLKAEPVGGVCPDYEGGSFGIWKVEENGETLYWLGPS